MKDGSLSHWICYQNWRIEEAAGDTNHVKCITQYLFLWFFFFSQTIRETWGNSSAFNLKQFTVIHHSKLKTEYLNVNYSEWKTYAKNGDDRLSAYSTDFHVQTIFLVGQTTNNQTQTKIIEESQNYHDIIQESFIDTYKNLTLKTVMMLKWVTDNCANKGADNSIHYLNYYFDRFLLFEFI